MPRVIVLDNLSQDGLALLEAAGNIEHEVRTGLAEERIEVIIQDDGVGIPAAALSKIFDLFHTSKPAGKGSGLGLAIVHDIIKRLGGEIHVASEEGQWTRFTLILPLETPA